MLTYSGVYATFGLYRGAFAPNNSLVFGQIPYNQPGQAETDSPYQLAWTISSQQAVKQTESHFILLVYSNFFVPYLGVYAEYLGAYAYIQELMLNIQELMLTSDLQIVVKLRNEVPRNIFGSQKVWVIFQENEIFLGH